VPIGSLSENVYTNLFTPSNALQFQPKAAGASRLALQHLIDILLEVIQAFLLLDAQQLLGIVTLAAVGDHHSRIVGRNQFPDLFVAMPAANLKHRGLVGVEGHQMGRFPVNPPTGVIGVDRRRAGHTGTQLLVGIPHHPLRLLQRVLGQCALRHFDSRELSQNGGQLANRHAHAVMHRMRRCLDTGTDTMRRRPILIGCHVRVLSAYPLAAPLAPPHLHRIALHFRLCGLRHIRDRRLVGPLIPQLTAAARALTDRHGHFDRRLTARPSAGWSLPERKGALPSLAAGPFGLSFRLLSPTPRPSPRRLQLLAQFLILPAQPIDILFGLLQTLAQNFDFLFQFLDSLEGRAGVCTCHSKLRYPKLAEKSSVFPLINYGFPLPRGE